MLSPELLRASFQKGLAYDDYVATGKPHHQASWRDVASRVVLPLAQRALIASFSRRMPVLVTSGTWCGDCAAQVPMLRAIEGANPGAITLRILDRDAHPKVSEALRICGGLRVPTVVFMNEDFEFVHLMGDRTIARYRAMAAAQLGVACPLPGAPTPPDEDSATLADWVEEFERVQLLLRLSPKLRDRHGD